MKLLLTWLANYRESYLVELSLLHLNFFKTILADLFKAISLPLLFLSSKPSFFDDHFTTENSNFSIFLSAVSTDKPVNRSKHAYALTQLNVFAFRGFFFSFIIFTKNKEGV